MYMLRNPETLTRHTDRHTPSRQRARVRAAAGGMSTDTLLAVSVLGDPCPASALGSDVLLHEHVCFDLTSRLRAALSADEAALREEPITLERLHVLREHARANAVALRTPPEEVLLRELAALRAGRPPFSCTIVDISLDHAGRDPRALMSLSAAAGVHIVMAAGVSAEEVARAHADEEAMELLTDRLVSELTQGVSVSGADAGVRCGLLVCSEECRVVRSSSIANDMTDDGRSARDATLRVLGQAQMRTGAPLLVPLPATLDESFGSGAVSCVSELVQRHGAIAAAIVIGHAQHLLATEGGRTALEELLALGVSLCFDGLGNSWEVAGADAPRSEPRGGGGDGAGGKADDAMPLAETEVARAIGALVAGGHASQLLLSHSVASRLQLATYGGAGLTHARRSLAPRLRRCGVAEEAVEGMLGGNAARLLCWWTPAAKGERLTRPWTCVGCDRSFVEAVNEAEALPDDQPFYEKFERRYCSMHCLAAHRKANFAMPFACQPPA